MMAIGELDIETSNKVEELSPVKEQSPLRMNRRFGSMRELINYTTLFLAKFRIK